MCDGNACIVIRPQKKKNTPLHLECVINRRQDQELQKRTVATRFRAAMIVGVALFVTALAPTGPRAAFTAAPARAAVRLGFLDSLFKKETVDEIIGDVANPCDLSTAELAALKEASVSDEAPGRLYPNLADAPSYADRFTIREDAPKSLFNDGYPPLPMTYFVMLRSERALPVPDELWPAIRDRWPVLAERSDEELIKAMEPIKAVYVDSRRLGS